MSLTNLTKDNFDDIIYDEAENSVVIFSTKTCAICKMVKPILAKLSDKYAREYKFYQVDAEENMNLFNRFSLSGVPQILFFEDGELKGKLSGKITAQTVEQKLQTLYH